MTKLILILVGLILVGCTPTVKKFAVYKNQPEDVVLVKKGNFYLGEEENRFIAEESRRLGIEIPDRKEIRKYLDFFLENKGGLEIALKRAKLYVPYIRPILREHGLPEELALLPLIESSFNPFAVSRSGAGGIWQLMPQTAKRYGLRIDNSVDERFDLYRSTEAAAKYLRDLYSMFGSWELALAAYNCGEGCVMRRTGGADFWKSEWALPDETRKYVPMFFAALLIAESPDKYGLKVNLENLSIDRKYVTDEVSVKEFVKVASLKESTFRDLNPHIRGNYIPSGVYVYIPEISDFKNPPERGLEPTESQTKPTLRFAGNETEKSEPHNGKVKAEKAVKEKKVADSGIKTQVKTIVVSREPEVPQNNNDRIIIKLSGNPFENTRELRLENGAVVYIKE